MRFQIALIMFDDLLPLSSLALCSSGLWSMTETESGIKSKIIRISSLLNCKSQFVSRLLKTFA